MVTVLEVVAGKVTLGSQGGDGEKYRFCALRTDGNKSGASARSSAVTITLIGLGIEHPSEVDIEFPPDQPQASFSESCKVVF